jgi:hypothetical protein
MTASHRVFHLFNSNISCRLRLKCDGTRVETRFRLPAKRTNPFKSAGASVQSTTGSRDVSISVSNAAYTMFRRSVKSTGYPLHSPVSPSLPLPCVTMGHHFSTGLYCKRTQRLGNWLFTSSGVKGGGGSPFRLVGQQKGLSHLTSAVPKITYFFLSMCNNKSSLCPNKIRKRFLRAF